MIGFCKALNLNLNFIHLVARFVFNRWNECQNEHKKMRRFTINDSLNRQTAQQIIPIIILFLFCFKQIKHTVLCFAMKLILVNYFETKNKKNLYAINKYLNSIKLIDMLIVIEFNANSCWIIEFNVENSKMR